MENLKTEILVNLNAHKTEMEACCKAFKASKDRKGGFDDMMFFKARYDVEKGIVDSLISILETCGIAYGWDPLKGVFYFPRASSDVG